MTFLLLIPAIEFAQVKRPVFTSTPTYNEVIHLYDSLDKASNFAELKIVGQTDIGLPLHVFVISGRMCFNKANAEKNKLPVILINNGIHPGEPDGIDASLQLAKDILSHPAQYQDLLQKVVICIIPIYNVDGSLNRSHCSRANQNGPIEYGFRGNAKNLDLNRDFMKMDSENAKSFASVFHLWEPHLFIDTHVSDGADYQYVMTYILSQKDKMNSKLANYQDKVLLPAVQKFMSTKPINNPAIKGNVLKTFEMTPYVNTMGETPESGVYAFLETARFATGYAALFDCMGIISETHMLKPYNDRVWATYWFLLSSCKKIALDAKVVYEQKEVAKKETASLKMLPIAFDLDTAKHAVFSFKGYKSTHIVSEVSGLPRLFYDRKKPFTKKINYYLDYKAGIEINLPDYYIIPQGWKKVIDNLVLNGVEVERIQNDTAIELEVTYIENYETVKTPYESHYLHSKTKVRKEKQVMRLMKGDVKIKMDTPLNRFIGESLEPQSVDSYFNWNFFDGILQQKEWFSDYVFEDVAAKLLKEDPELKSQLELLKANDKAFAEDAFSQLLWVYHHSAYYEKSHNRLPVYRGFN